MASLLKATSNVLRWEKLPFLFTPKTRHGTLPSKASSPLAPLALSTETLQHQQKSNSPDIAIPIMANSCTGKMGKAVIKAADSAGLHVVPVSFGSEKESGQTVEVCGKEIVVHGPSERESVLASAFQEYPNLIVVDYTVPATVNDNAELYCKVGVPFVMGTTGGDRDQLFKTVEESKVFAVISPQMGKQPWRSWLSNFLEPSLDILCSDGIPSSKQIGYLWNCKGCNFLLSEVGGFS